jgi:hypothetical protein
VASDPSDVGSDWGLGDLVVDCLWDVIVCFEEVKDQGLQVKGPFKVIDYTFIIKWVLELFGLGLL